MAFRGEPEHGKIGLAVELALRRTAVADLQRIVPDAIVGDEVMVILDPAQTAGLPDSTADLGPGDLHVGIGMHDLAVIGVAERQGCPRQESNLRLAV